MNWAQIVIAILLAISFFRLLYIDINGRPAREPMGFPCVVATFIVFAIFVWLYWCAGLFSSL